MQLSYLKNFLVTAEHKSFAEAAEKLYLSTPALLKQTRMLERELGFPLFTRSRKGISLTNGGKDLYLTTGPIVKALEEEIEKCRIKACATKRKIVFGIYGSDSEQVAPAMYKAINKKYPNCTLEYRQIETKEISKMLLEHQIDCCIPYGFNRKKLQPGLVYIPLLEDEPICIIPKSLGFSNRQAVQLSNLEGANLLIVEKGHDIFHDMIYREIADKNLQINVSPVKEGIIDGKIKLSTHPLIFIASRLSVSYQEATDYIPLIFPRKIPFGLAFREEDQELFYPFVPTIKAALMEAKENWQKIGH